MSSVALFMTVVAILNGERGVPFRCDHRLAGYVIVGSAALPEGGGEGSDVDAVLISQASLPGMATALRDLGAVLQAAPELTGATVWFVNATVPILKLQQGAQSVDLLWLGGCQVPSDAADDDGLRVVGAETLIDFEAEEDEPVSSASGGGGGGGPPPPAYEPPRKLRAFQPEDAVRV